MLFRELVDTSADVARVSGRNGKIDRLAALLTRLTPEEIDIAVAFLSGSLRQGRIGLGWAAISAAMAVIPASEPRLLLRDVDDAFERVASASGPGSAASKARVLHDLMTLATAAEQDFLVRLLAGELRQGALEGVLSEAIAKASRLPPALVRRAAMMAGALGLVARAALIEGASALDRFSVQLMRPVQPMLADTAEDVADALARLRTAAFELKVDGARVQVHKAGAEVRVFSRNLREVTTAVPEIVETMRALPVRAAIFDGEVIALRADRTPHQFQVTMQRFGRRLDVDRLRAELPLTPFLFDCLYLDDGPLIDEPQARRFQALTSIAGPLVVPYEISPTPERAEAFLQDALRAGHEGVMAKALDAPYAAGRRGQAWLKIKAAKTLDLVVLGVEWGHGRRQGLLSNLHLGARDPDRDTFVMLGKTFKGLTDEMLAWQTEKLLSLETSRDRYTVHVRPELVVEIAFNDLQESPVYPGGLALRFARVKGHRPDKNGAEADTFETVRGIYRRMTGKEPPVPRW